MLDNFITSLIRTTANNPRLLTRLIVLDRDSVFADVFEPDELEGAGTAAVDTFLLVLADDYVFEGCAGVEEEYCICVAWRRWFSKGLGQTERIG